MAVEVYVLVFLPECSLSSFCLWDLQGLRSIATIMAMIIIMTKTRAAMAIPMIAGWLSMEAAVLSEIMSQTVNKNEEGGRWKQVERESQREVRKGAREKELGQRKVKGGGKEKGRPRKENGK